MSGVVFLGGSVVKNLPVIPETWVGSILPLEKEMGTHSRVLPGKFHGQKTPAGYSPWGRIQSATTEQLIHNGQMARILSFERQQKKLPPWANFCVTPE